MSRYQKQICHAARKGGPLFSSLVRLGTKVLYMASNGNKSYLAGTSWACNWCMSSHFLEWIRFLDKAGISTRAREVISLFLRIKLINWSHTVIRNNAADRNRSIIYIWCSWKLDRLLWVKLLMRTTKLIVTKFKLPVIAETTRFFWGVLPRIHHRSTDSVFHPALHTA